MFPWLKQLFLYFSLTALLLVSLVSFGVYVNLRQASIPLALSQLEQVADLKTDQIKQWFTILNSSLIEDLNEPTLLANTATLLTTSIKTKPDYQKAYSALKTYFSLSDNTRLNTSILSNGGIILFSTDARREGQYQPLQNTTTYFSLKDINRIKPNFYKSSITNEPMITFAISLVNNTGKRIGAIAIDLNLIDLDHQIRQPIQASNPSIQTIGITTESYLVGRLSLVENAFIAKQNEIANSPILNGSGVSPLAKPLDSMGISQALQGKTGSGLYLNYNKVPVIGNYRWMPDYRLGLLVEITQAEVFSFARFYAGQIVSWGIAIILAVSILPFIFKNYIHFNEL